MRERYISGGLEQDTAHSSEQFHSFYLQDHTKSVLKEIGDSLDFLLESCAVDKFF